MKANSIKGKIKRAVAFALVLAVMLSLGAMPVLASEQPISFECAYFEAAVRRFPTVPDTGYVFPSHVSEIATFWQEGGREGGNITSLAGIEYFISLRTLIVESQQLTTIDVSNNTSLTLINVMFNQLTTIDVSNNTSLITLFVSNNQLTTLDLSNNSLLRGLFASFNRMESIETSLIGLSNTRIIPSLEGRGTQFVDDGPGHTFNFHPQKGQDGWLRPTPPAQLFPDSRNHWAAAPIGWAYANRITLGTSPTSFSPNRGVTRAEFVTFLHRMAGSPAITGTNPFRDVSSNAWFAGTVTWASTSGITAGTSPTTFHPNRAITREEMTVMLFRFIRDIVESDNLASPADALDRFPDRGQVSGWAQDSVRWAADQGIIGAGGRLNPRGNATRAETVTMLYRLVDTFNISAP